MPSQLACQPLCHLVMQLAHSPPCRVSEPASRLILQLAFRWPCCVNGCLELLHTSARAPPVAAAGKQLCQPCNTQLQLLSDCVPPAPAAGIQISLLRESVAWKRGPWAVPPIIGKVLGRLRSVLDSLAAVEMVLVQQPVISKHYSANPFLFIMKPLAEHLQSTMDHIKQVRPGLGKREPE